MTDSADQMRTIRLPHYAQLGYDQTAAPLRDKYRGWLKGVPDDVIHVTRAEIIQAIGARLDSPYQADPGTERWVYAECLAERIVERAIHMWQEWPSLSDRQRRNRWDDFQKCMRDWRREDGRDVPAMWDREKEEVVGGGPYTQQSDGLVGYETGQENSKSFKVYFIGAAEGPIKIGISINPRSRLASIQTGSAVRLSLLATCKGSPELEQEYHRRFADHRLHGEWFERHPDILAEIERLSA